MYGIFTYIYHKNQPNAGKYTIHGSFGVSQPIENYQGFLLGPPSLNQIAGTPHIHRNTPNYGAWKKKKNMNGDQNPYTVTFHEIMLLGE